jgi:hypothetical protein
MLADLSISAIFPNRFVPDGHAFGAGGIAGSFALDALISIAACNLAGLSLVKFDRSTFRYIP